MQKYYDSVLLDSGMPAVGVSVTVTAFGGGAVTIYSDNGATPRANPITTDANGYFEFYAADGRYTIQISGASITTRTITDILLEDPADGNAVLFSTLTATGQVSLGGVANAESLRISQAPTNAVNRIQVIGTVTLGEPKMGTEGSDTDINYGHYTKGAGAHRFLTSGGTLEQLRVSHTATAVNFLNITGAIATASPSVTAQGSDTNVGINYSSKGSAQHTFNNGNVAVNTVGSGLRVKEGSNAKQGTVTLAAGSSVVANTSVTAASRIFLTSNADGGTPGFLRVSARSAGVSFTITSSSGTDTSTVAYQIFEPA
jgi:hypothetical protein